MPYVRCKSCGVLTYCVRGEHCPSCDAELLPISSRAPGRPPLVTGLRRTLALAARQLGMEASVLGEVTDGREVVRRVAGEAEALGITEGVGAPLADTYCLRLLEGRIPGHPGHPRRAGSRRPACHPGAAHPLLHRCAAATRGRAPLRALLPVWRRERRPHLGDQETKFLRGVAESIRGQLDG